MADITKSSGDGAKVSTHVLNGPATKESTLKYSPQDPGPLKEPISGPLHSVQKPNSSNAPGGKSKETRFEIVNVSSYSYTEDPSVDELEETSNTEDLTSENREASQADELEEGEPTSDGLNLAEDSANGSPHPTSIRDPGSSSHPHLQSKPLTSTPTNQASTKPNPSTLINGVESDVTTSTTLDHAKFSANSSNVALSSRNEPGECFSSTRDEQHQSSSPLGSGGSTKPGILTSGVVTPTGDAVVTSYTTSHGTWSTSGADFVQHSDSSMEPSRFRVVKIHSDKKIRRGRWQCQDYYDASSEKAAANKDSEAKASLPDGGSGNSSAASSVHYVHGENPASDNPLVKMMAENPPDEFIPTILTTTDSQKFLVIPQLSEAKGAWGMQTPGNVFAGDHPLLQHTQRAVAPNASQPSHGTPSVGHHQQGSPYGKVEVSNSKSSPKSLTKDGEGGSAKIPESFGKSSPESVNTISAGPSQSTTNRPTSHPHPNFNSNSCSFSGGKEIEDASHSGDAERGRRDTTSFDGHGSPVRVKTGSEPPSDSTIASGVHVLPLVQTPNPKEEIRNSVRFSSASMPNSNEALAKVASIPDLRAGGSSVATPVSSDQGSHHPALSDNSATFQQQQSTALSTNQNSGRGYQLPGDANLGAFPPSGGSSPSVPSASKESSPQSLRATQMTTGTTATTTSIHTNVSSPPSVTAQAHALSSVMPPGPVATSQTQSGSTGGQFPGALSASTPAKQLPPNLSIQSSTHRPTAPSASSHPAAQNLVNSAMPPQQPSPSSAIPSPTLVGGAVAQSISASNQLPNVNDSQPSQHQSTLPSRGSQQQQQQALPTVSIDKESSKSKISSAESSDPSNLQQSQQHPKAPSIGTHENGKPQPETLERDSNRKLTTTTTTTTTVSPPKPASVHPTMTQDSVGEKSSTPSTSRFKVTGVPESEILGAAPATAFKPAVAQQSLNSPPDSNSTTRVEESDGGLKRPTTIPLDSASHASRRGSVNDSATASEKVGSGGAGGNGGGVVGGKVEAEQENAERDPELAGDTILDLKQELKEGVSPLSRQSSKRDVDAESEGSGTEEGAGVSTVAIDNKIEQAMDLVKSHLMYAVREEVEVLKEQIKELIEKNQQLEMENAYLKSNATPDLLKQLQAHVDSSPTPPPVMAAPVGSILQSATPGNTTGLATGQFSTQNVISQTSAGVAAGGASSTASAASTNVTHTIGLAGSSSQSIPSTLPSGGPAPTGGGAFSSSSPSNP